MQRNQTGERIQKQKARKRAERPKRVFNVFEAGSGRKPIGLLEQALRAEAKGSRRRFTGVDAKEVNVEALLKRTDVNRMLEELGLPKRMPRNLRLIQGDAVRAVESLKPESQNVISATYLLNNLVQQIELLNSHPATKDITFLYNARKALKPGGRIFLIQDRANITVIRKAAEELGFELRAIDVPDEKSEKSFSQSVRLRSTPDRRRWYMERYYKKNLETDRAIRALMREGIIKTPEDYAKPTIYVLRKPGKNEPKKAIKFDTIPTRQTAVSIDPATREKGSVMDIILGSY